MATISVRRKSEMNNKLRVIGLYIDGEKVGTIMDGETREFEVSDGQHEVYAKIDWCGSPKVKLDTSDGKLTLLILSGFKFGQWVIPIMLVLLVLTMLLIHVFDVPFLYIFWLPALSILYPTYYITIGKDQYLLLKNADNQQ